MTVSKAWDWDKESDSIWLQTSEESYYVAQKWKDKNVKRMLDFGCGLGSLILSEEATELLKSWAEKENLSMDVHLS